MPRDVLCSHNGSDLVESALQAQDRDFVPVTDDVLLKPDPADWLQWGRTYDWHRFSTLDQVNRGNVHRRP